VECRRQFPDLARPRRPDAEHWVRKKTAFRRAWAIHVHLSAAGSLHERSVRPSIVPVKNQFHGKLPGHGVNLGLCRAGRRPFSQPSPARPRLECSMSVFGSYLYVAANTPRNFRLSPPPARCTLGKRRLVPFRSRNLHAGSAAFGMPSHLSAEGVVEARRRPDEVIPLEGFCKSRPPKR